eukprot:m.25087 g.25087  ORF g.25087 m.25087 type:complete len:411 (-) comp7674_c0_seq2:42-1274(-)
MMSGSDSDEGYSNVDVSGDVVHEGYLTKAPPQNKSGKAWKKRWCVLRSGSHTLYYYKNQDSCYQGHRPKGSVAVTSCEPAEPYHGPSKHGNLFCLRSTARLFLFSAASKEELDLWIDRLRMVRDQVFGIGSRKPKDMPPPPDNRVDPRNDMSNGVKYTPTQAIYHDDDAGKLPEKRTQAIYHQEIKSGRSENVENAPPPLLPRSERNKDNEPILYGVNKEESKLNGQKHQDDIVIYGADKDARAKSKLVEECEPKPRYEDQPWYFGVLSRADAERVLREAAAETSGGMFLIRQSDHKPELAMSWIGGEGSEVVHTRILKLPDGKWVFNSKHGPPAKPTLVELIDSEEFRSMLMEADKSFRNRNNAPEVNRKSVQEEFYAKHTPTFSKRDNVLAQIHSEMLSKGVLPPKID